MRLRRSNTLIALATALALCLTARDARAAAGDLDASFGDGGVTRIDIGRIHTSVQAVLLHDDGKVTVAGAAGTTLLLARYLADGSPDPSFGTGGRVLENPPGWAEGARAAALQPDGKLVVVGRSRTGFSDELSVARFLDDGSLDPDFGTGGLATADISMSMSTAADVLIQPDGGILVTTSAGVSRLALARFDDEGTPDASFGSGGKTELSLAPRSTQGRAAALQSDGSIIVVGVVAVTGATDRRYFVARLDSSGVPDPNFGTQGRFYLDVALRAAGDADVVVQPDDRIVVVVEQRSNEAGLVALRYDADGIPDASFGVQGETRAIGSEFSGFRVALEEGGTILVAGGLHGNSGFTVARILANGVLKRRFGDGGFVPNGFADGGRAEDLAVGPAGIALAGMTWSERDGLTSQLAVLRLDADGARELGFGDRGVVTESIRAANDIPTGLATRPDGDVVVAGWAFGGGTAFDMGAARLDADGTLDDGFGVGGKIRVDSTSPDDLSDETPEGDEPNGIAVQPDGRIIGAGSWHPGQDAYKLMRLTAVGDLDLSFGNEGGLRFPSSCDRYLYSVGLEPDGSILAAGASTFDCGGVVEVVRVSASGERDLGFGTNGVLLTDLRANVFGTTAPLVVGSDGTFAVGGRLAAEDKGAVERYVGSVADDDFGNDGIATIDLAEFASGVAALAVAADGSLIAAADPGSGDLSLARLDASGVLDENFGDDGLASADFGGGQDQATSLVLQSDGKIVVAGVSQLGPAVRAVVARFTGGGELDGSFGDGGKVVLPMNPDSLWYPVPIAIAKDGGVLVAAAVRFPASVDFVVARLVGDSASVCGNGAIEPGEICDDGDVASGDGCSASCAIETCFRCSGAPSACSATDANDPACEPAASCPASGDPSYADEDGDGRDDTCDRCPGVAGIDDDDADHDRIGDACDLCPWDFDLGAQDSDGDGVGDSCDDCEEDQPLVDTRLRLSGLETAPGDDTMVLRGSFELQSGETLESLVGKLEIEVHDVRDGIAFDSTLRNGNPPQQTGWKATPSAPWAWRYHSVKGKFPKVTAKLRADPDNPGHAQLNVAAHRGSFASLAPELPLRVIVRRFNGAATCAKIVHAEGGSSCQQLAGGNGLRCR